MTRYLSSSPGRSPTKRSLALALAAGGALALASGAAQAMIDTTYTGYTDGCFGLACVPASPPAPVLQDLSFAGLTYHSGVFSNTTSGGFLSIGSQGGTTAAANSNNLGSFSLSSLPFDYTGTHFDVRVTFSAPPGILPSNSLVFTDTVSGQVSATAAGGVFIDFDNTPKLFTFGSGADAGSFSFFINDVSVSAGDTIAVSGTILSTVVAAVPEPETYALFMAGLGAIGFMARRRRSNTP